MQVRQNTPLPLGVHREGTSVHFRVVSEHAKKLTLGLFLHPDGQKLNTPTCEIQFDPQKHRTGSIWHLCVDDVPLGFAFGYRIPNENKSTEPTWLLDPYAPLVVAPHEWCSVRTDVDSGYHPLSALDGSAPFDWENDKPLCTPLARTLIYEMHVRGFTMDSSSEANHPGTFLGLIEKIPHLQALGVTAVELLPIMEWNEAEYHACSVEKRKLLCNYWGYSTVHFLSPMARFASQKQLGCALNEFKEMVKALHSAGIEVILDIVWNHTAEGGKKGPVYSFKGLDRPIYYLVDNSGHMMDFTGCGNTVQTNHPHVIDYILYSLRYWVLECHVDGFRFDLASVFHRGRLGHFIDLAPVVEAITHDPVLSKTKLIAESWDATGLYQVGSFYKAGPSRWSEWNGKYRDDVRNFIKGTPHTVGIFATRLCGSRDLYGAQGSPLNSINFIIAHDGYTLRDLVSYQKKHNRANGEANRDGTDNNDSWNCGCEGPTHDIKIMQLRERQMRNFLIALFISQGVPMILMGDEYGHTKQGNNNTWCQDNRLNWFLWDELDENKGLFRFTCLLSAFRKRHADLLGGHFLNDKDIIWHGTEPKSPHWGEKSHFIAFQLVDSRHHRDLAVAFNAGSQKESWQLPPPPPQTTWYVFANTSQLAPSDIYALNHLPRVKDIFIEMLPYSSCVLCAR